MRKIIFVGIISLAMMTLLCACGVNTVKVDEPVSTKESDQDAASATVDVYVNSENEDWVLTFGEGATSYEIKVFNNNNPDEVVVEAGFRSIYDEMKCSTADECDITITKGKDKYILKDSSTKYDILGEYIKK